MNRCVLLLLAVVCSVVAQGQRFQPLTGPVPRTADGKPDLNGVWEHPFVPDMTKDDVNQKGEPQLPFTQWGANEWKTYDAANGDYTGACLPFGLTRSINSPYPIQIVQTPKKITMLFEYVHAVRHLYIDGTPHPPGHIDWWMGDSRGKWEGDVFVVSVTNHNDKTWLDMVGNFHSDALKVTERYQMTDANTIQYEATLDDSKAYTKPWTIRFALKRRTDRARLSEYVCTAEMEEPKGLFEREVRTWYPGDGNPVSQIPASTYVPAKAPTVAGFPRTADGTPDLNGFFVPNSPGANQGLEKHSGGLLTAGKIGRAHV